MKERPILFSAPMVRAILEGRKTQTRRIVKLPHSNPLGVWEPTIIGGENGGSTKGGGTIPAQGGIWHTRTGECLMSPHGQPGDRLWVRETWQGPLFDDELTLIAYQHDPEDFEKPEYCVYAADGGPAPEFMNMDDELVCRWRPSIHMPRWASRINLEITGVRVERLQDISEEDAWNEGVQDWMGKETPWKGQLAPVSVHAFATLWEQIGGSGSWAANPWVWVVEFRRLK